MCALITAALTLMATPAPAYADDIRSQQWYLEDLRVSTAWRYAKGKNIVVAVLDSGVDASHPDLEGKVLPGADFVDGNGDDQGDGRTDTVGHGTTVAALIAGDDDEAGIVGIAPQARILPVRVLDQENRYRDAQTVADGLRWAVDHGARVVNMSLGGSVASPELADAIQYAYDHDVVVVACAGNLTEDGETQIWYPAREPGVIAVTGLTSDMTFWEGSLSGPESVLAAPAADLIGARPGGYWKVEGTSFAAPIVAGTAALIRSHWPDMSAANVVNRLIQTARDLGPSGRDQKYGFGVVDPVRALTNPVTSVRHNPLDTTPRTVEPSVSWSASQQPHAAAAAQHSESSPWLWVGLGGFAAIVSVGTGVVLVALRRRRNPQAAYSPPLVWPHHR